MKIWANTILYNEENFVWFAVMSIIDWVDKIVIWDTGSTDKTLQILKVIKKLKKNKVIFKKVGSVSAEEFPKVRQLMLEQSSSDWILILDGDEIWWEKSIKKLVDKINKVGEGIDGIVVPMIVSVGDIYHHQEEKAGRYEILGRRGHFTLRAINKKIPGLHVDWPYGKESYLGENNKVVQERKKIIFLNAPYMHVTHLKRSSKGRKYNKIKYELGKSFAKDFKYPEVFFKSYPKEVPNPWVKPTKIETLRMFVETPLKKIKRKIL